MNGVAIHDFAAEDCVQVAEDVCALSLAQRLAAMVDRDPASLREGQALPRGWHVMLFNAPTLQSRLRGDGAGHLGVTLPDISLPRLMLGGRQISYLGDIPLGARVRRETRQGEVQHKEGRSGRFAVVKVEHRIFAGESGEPVIVESNDYLLRPANTDVQPVAAQAAAQGAPPRFDVERTIVTDEPLLFRYSGVTDNPHRIHYDLAYATGVEGYPALVVNGSIPAMFLLEMFRTIAGREPTTWSSRNVAPMFCGRPLTLRVAAVDDGWRLWACDADGATTFDARVV